MASTYLSAHPGDVERWAAERDVVPVREADGYAVVRSGAADLDQERLHWDEFHAENEDHVVVLHDAGEGRGSLSMANRSAVLDRLDLARDEREGIEARLEAAETVDVSSATPDDGTLQEVGTGTATDSGHGTRTEPADRDVGKPVVVGGDQVGLVTAIDDDGLLVDPHPGLTRSALATLGWTGADDEDVRVGGHRIDRITTEAVRLAEATDRDEFRESGAER